MSCSEAVRVDRVVQMSKQKRPCRACSREPREAIEIEHCGRSALLCPACLADVVFGWFGTAQSTETGE
jgi:hypothetical protein